MSEVVVWYSEEITETDAAVLFEFENGQEWIPKSLIIDRDEEAKEITIPEWIAMEKGLV